MAQILMVLTSHDQLGDTAQPTGFWLEELAAPYYVFLEAGHEVILASMLGGQPPMDPESHDSDNQSEIGQQFLDDQQAMLQLANTTPLVDIQPEDYDAVFYPGGHGPIWDLAESPHSIEIVEAMYAVGKPVSAVCHGPVVFRHAKAPSGKPLVAGKQVTAFSNSEEIAVHKQDVVPYLIEDELIRLGGHYQKGDDWSDFSIADGHLITGQNPASSRSCAKKMLVLLN